MSSIHQFEVFVNAERLSRENITEDIADKVLRALCDVHATYVYHGDIHRRNILLLLGERIVWIDFDHSRCASNERLGRVQLFRETLKEQVHT